MENFVYHHDFDSFPIHKGFSDEIGGDINKCDFVTTFGRSEELSKPMCFKLPMYDVTKSGMSERSPHSTRRQMDFNVIKYEKFVGMVSDSTLLVTFKKSQLIKF